jgi:hypothetical protein
MHMLDFSVQAEPMQLDSAPSSPWRGFRVSQANDQKLMKLHSVVETLLRKMLVRGVHGEVLVKFSVYDGMIEQIEECVRRKYR